MKCRYFELAELDQDNFFTYEIDGRTLTISNAYWPAVASKKDASNSNNVFWLKKSNLRSRCRNSDFDQNIRNI